MNKLARYFLKVIEGGFLIMLAVVLFCIVFFGLKSCSRQESGQIGAPGPSTSAPSTSAPGTPEAEDMPEEPAPLPPTPDVALSINSESELSVYAGTPLILTVRLANQRGSNILFTNAAESNPDGRRPVPLVKLESDWPQSVRINIRAGSDVKRLTWPVAPMGGHGAQAVTLDGRTGAEAQWGLSPDASAGLAPGTYSLVAVLEVTDRKAGAWQGRVESEPVMLTVGALPESPKGPDAVQSDLDLARYWALAQDWEKSLAAARTAADEDPGSISARMLIGDALYAQKDADGALAAYETALTLFRQQPEKDKPYEPPDYLLNRISQIARDRRSNRSDHAP